MLTVAQAIPLIKEIATQTKSLVKDIKPPTKEYLTQYALAKIDDYVRHTPDGEQLERAEWQLMFMYGNYMRGGRRYGSIKDESKYICDGFTTDNYKVWDKKLGIRSFPVALRSDAADGNVIAGDYADGKGFQRGIPPAKIRGHLLAIRPQRYYYLDTVHRNMYDFERKRVKVHVPSMYLTGVDGLVTSLLFPKIIEAWMYVGIPKYWDTQIDAGYLFQPVKIYQSNKPWRDLYYYYQQSTSGDKSTS